MSVEAAKGRSYEAKKLVDETREIKKEIGAEAKKISKIKETTEEDAARDKELRVTTTESVAQAPDRADLALAGVTADLVGSAMDKAIDRAVFHQQHDQQAEAIDLWRAIAVILEETDSNSNLAARAWFSIGYLLDNEVREAMAAYDKAIEIKPDFAMAYSNRGAAKAEQGSHEDAQADFDKAAELNFDSTNQQHGWAIDRVPDLGAGETARWIQLETKGSQSDRSREGLGCLHDGQWR